MERSYDIRPQTRTVPENTLEGVFRVYMSADALAAEKLRQGEWICLRNKNTPATGVKGGLGIAWRVQESNLKRDCVKVHEALRTLYSLELKDKISISKFAGDFRRIRKVVLDGFVRSDKGTTDNEIQQHELEFEALIALCNVEGICEGLEFMISPRSGSKLDRKRRLRVDRIVPVEQDQVSQDIFIPFVLSATSQVEIAGEEHAEQPDSASVALLRDLKITNDQFHGLDRQLAQLNHTLEKLSVNIAKSSRARRIGSIAPVLLHGPPGTGKTAILDRLCALPWAKVQRLQCAQISASFEKMKAMCNAMFKDAKEFSPSLMAFDQIDHIVGSQAETQAGMASFLSDQIRSLKGSQVLFIGATQKSTSVHNEVVRCFRKVIDLPIPTETARSKMLGDLIGDAASHDLLRRIAERTPAFIADDLEHLCSVAIEHAELRTQALNAVQSTEVDSVEEPELTVIEADFDLALNQVHPSVMAEAYVEVPKVRWTDIGGSEEVKAKLDSILYYPSRHARLMTEFKVESSSGILLYGPPGCSKTLTAKAVATESGRNFIAVKGPELISKYVGESEMKIREVFRKARDAAPAVIFFDEIDSIAPKRDGGSGGGGHEGLNTVAALLNEMDGIEGAKDVLVLAATNRPMHIDPALLRPGRLGTMIYMGPPNEDARRQILQLKTKDRRAADNLDIDTLAKRTVNFSGADVVELCNRAAYQAVRDEVADGKQGHVHLGMPQFEFAFEDMKPSLSLQVVEELEAFEVAGVTKVQGTATMSAASKAFGI